jgi:hypothetical protein
VHKVPGNREPGFTCTDPLLPGGLGLPKKLNSSIGISVSNV